MKHTNIAPILSSLAILILDIDGVLTRGDIVYSSDGDEFKGFDVKDGLGLVMLRSMGIRTAIVTGRHSQVVERRAKELCTDFILQGFPIKLPAYQKLKEELALPDASFGFIGDDLIDLDVMRQVGFAAAPADAHPAVKAIAHYVAQKPGGCGAVREIIDMIIAFRRAEFGAQNYIPIELLERWQDFVWERLAGVSIAKDGQ